MDDLEIPHGTITGYKTGCNYMTGCPNYGTPWLTCSEAHRNYQRSPQYQALVDAGADATRRDWRSLATQQITDVRSAVAATSEPEPTDVAAMTSSSDANPDLSRPTAPPPIEAEESSTPPPLEGGASDCAGRFRDDRPARLSTEGQRINEDRRRRHLLERRGPRMGQGERDRVPALRPHPRRRPITVRGRHD